MKFSCDTIAGEIAFYSDPNVDQPPPGTLKLGSAAWSEGTGKSMLQGQSPADSSAAGDFYEFGIYRLEAANRSLYRAGEFVPLAPKIFDTLLVLVLEAGRVVTKEELMQKVWPDSFVEEGGIANNISALRKLMNPDFGGEGPIATVPRRGYRFTADARLRNAAGEISVHAPAPDAAVPPPPKALPATRTSNRWKIFAAAFAGLLVLSAGAYYAYMRLGHRGISEKDSVVITDFENKTGEQIFDDALKQALTFDLEQSPRLNIIPDRKVESTLRMMGRPSEQKLAGETARDLCQRVTAKAMIVGSISGLESEYLIGLQAINCITGDTIVKEQARASGRAKVLSALDEAASKIRENLGESLASVQKFSVPVEEFTTPSLEALKAYNIGRKFGNDGDDVAAVPYIQRAVELDPNFASAYIGLALSYVNLGQATRGEEASKKAYDLRDRVSEHEKLRITSEYLMDGTGQLEEANRVYDLWSRDYPHDSIPHNNRASNLMSLGRWEEALRETQAAISLEPGLSQANSNISQIQLALGQYEECKKTNEAAISRNPKAGFVRLVSYQEAFLRNDTAEMQREFSWGESDPGEGVWIVDSRGDSEAYYGRMKSANSYFDRAIAAAKKSDNAEMGAVWETRTALTEAEFGNVAAANRHVAAALAMAPGRDVRGYVAVALARIGETAQSKKLMEALAKEFPQHTMLQQYWLPVAAAANDLHSKNPTEALQALALVEQMDLSLSFPFDYGTMYSVYLRGEAYLRLGNGIAAAAQYQKIVDHPGVVISFSLAPLAHLGLARAYALEGDKEKSRAAYDHFLELWKNADSDIPMLRMAQTERAQLN